jgi:hypothetical protein
MANVIIRIVAVTVFGIPEAFQYLQVSSVVSSTIVFMLMALLAFVLVGRFARRPIRFYRWLAFILLCVSWLSPVMALLGLLPAPHMSLSIFWTMIVMHTVSAIIVVGLLTTLTRE